jgi:hypothetical protein
MKGYKAFAIDWTCKNRFQYEIGQTYKMDENEIKMCEKGFHFCRVPFDIFHYYNHWDSKYAEISASGKILEAKDKCVCSQITIVKELTFKEIQMLMNGLFVRLDGTKEWWANGQLHRLDGPAIENTNGKKEWYFNGKRHRIDGPAIENNGTKEWWVNGTRHRENGPATEYVDGRKEWFQCHKLHRIDGPAIDWKNILKEWWINGKRHREDGPAIERLNGDKEWWINGNRHREDGPATEHAN